MTFVCLLLCVLAASVVILFVSRGVVKLAHRHSGVKKGNGMKGKYRKGVSCNSPRKKGRMIAFSEEGIR